MGVLMVNMEQHNPGYRGLWGLLAYPAIFMTFIVVPPSPERKRKIFTIVRIIGFAALADRLGVSGDISDLPGPGAAAGMAYRRSRAAGHAIRGRS